MKDLDEDLKAFGIKLEGWREAAQKVGRWLRRVEEGVEVFMRKWHKEGGNGRATQDGCNRGFNRWRQYTRCLLYTSPSPRDGLLSRMPSSA